MPSARTDIGNRTDWIDNSKPNAASMYYFLSGSYLSFAGDLGVAQEVFNMAMAHDVGSPQIRRAYFSNGVKLYHAVPAPEGNAGLAELLREARRDFQFDESMLLNAYRLYEKLNDKEGMQWAVSQLNKRFPSAWAYYFSFAMEDEQTGNGDLRLLAKAEESNPGDEHLAQMIALSWMNRDDDRAIKILQELAPSMLNETLLQTIMASHNDASLPDKHFASLSYPRDREAMAGFLYFYLQKADPQRILIHKEQIVQTEDPVLLYILATVALKQQSMDVYHYMLQELRAKPAAPETESKFAAVMLLQAIQQNDKAGMRDLSERIFRTSDINLAVFSAYLSAELSPESPEVKRAQLAQDIQNKLDESLLKDYLLFVLLDDAANRSAPAYLNYAEALFNKGFGDRADFSVVLEHYAGLNDEDTQISYLRRALQRWPREAMFLNNLGYLLLSRPPSNWTEAERLISAALKQEPDSVHYQDSMAWLLHLRGDYEAAKVYLPAMEAVAEGSAELSYHIGMIYLGLHNTETAIKFFKQAIQAETPQGYVLKAQEQLDLLK